MPTTVMSCTTTPDNRLARFHFKATPHLPGRNSINYYDCARRTTCRQSTGRFIIQSVTHAASTRITFHRRPNQNQGQYENDSHTSRCTRDFRFVFDFFFFQIFSSRITNVGLARVTSDWPFKRTCELTCTTDVQRVPR
jgi:hypothetical protein